MEIHDREDGENMVVDTQPNTVPIPAEWRALGAKRGYDPRPAEDLRLWVIGPSGEGKTTFVSGMPDNLILDFDGGADGIPGGKAIRIGIENYEQYDDVTKKLIADANAGKRLVKRVTFDTVDEWADLIQSQLELEKKVPDITEFGQRGHGYALIRGRCWSKLKALEQAGYTWTCVGHMTTKTETSPTDGKERTVLRESLFPTFAKKITTKSDFKLTLYSIPKAIEKTKTKIMTDGRKIVVPDGIETVHQYFVDSFTTAAKEGKSRAVPAMDRKIEIPLIGGWDLFARNYNDAVQAMRAKYNK